MWVDGLKLLKQPRRGYNLHPWLTTAALWAPQLQSQLAPQGGESAPLTEANVLDDALGGKPYGWGAIGGGEVEGECVGRRKGWLWGWVERGQDEGVCVMGDGGGLAGMR